MEERVLPEDIAAEQAVLGAILLDKNSINNIINILDADDFNREAHKVIYKAMLNLFFHDEPVDYVTLTNYLRSRDKLDAVGGLAYIMGLNAISAANITYHAAIIKNKAILRAMIEAGKIIQELGYNSADTEKAVDQAQHLVMQLSNYHHKEALQTESLSELFKSCLNKVITSNYQGIYTGLKKFDALTNGFHLGKLTILSGASGCGKTALALQIMANISTNTENKVIFITDSNLNEIALRLICVLAGVSCWKFKTNQMKDEEWNKIQQAVASTKSNNMGIYSLKASLMELVNRIRELYRENKMDLLFVDMHCLSQTDEQTMTKFKSLTEELGIAIIAITDKSSKEIVDLGIRLKKIDDIYKLLIEKQLGGPTGSIDMVFDNDLLLFKEKEKQSCGSSSAE